MNRFQKLALTLGLAGLAFAPTAAAELPLVTVYKSPSCGCCSEWVTHLEHNGFPVKAVDLRGLDRIKAMAGVTPQLASCHTANVNGYVIEGHVPAGDIKRLLAAKPDVRGLAVPGMPHGSPGMETGRVDRYQVLSFDEAGNTDVFARY